jgi:tRNA-dihydrouridine synthase B
MLAPMAGITNLPFRLICEELGCDLAFSEMVSAMGLHYAHEKTKSLIDSTEEEKALGVQLFGHDANVIADQAKAVEQELGEKLSHIDINMGCPAKKIVKKGDGAALMKDPAMAAMIVDAVKSSVKCPVTAKFRRGFNLDDETCVEFAKALENAGADALCVHGRFAMQYYLGKSDVSAIKRVKEAVKIPVIGNGDVFSVEDYANMKEATKCDAVLVARGASKNPLLFKQIKDYISGKNPKKPTANERMDVAIKHVKLIDSFKLSSSRVTYQHFRKQAMNYCEGIPGARNARKKICEAESCVEFVSIFEGLKQGE